MFVIKSVTPAQDWFAYFYDNALLFERIALWAVVDRGEEEGDVVLGIGDVGGYLDDVSADNLEGFCHLSDKENPEWVSAQVEAIRLARVKQEKRRRVPDKA